MSRVPHLPQILQGPLSARPSAAQTPEWIWYFAWDDDGGAFYRPTPGGWVKATPSVKPSWKNAELINGWLPVAAAPLQFRRIGDMVEMHGGASRNAGAFPSEVTALPSGYCPSHELRIPIVVGQTLSYASIAANGVITVYNPQTPGVSTDHRLYLDAVRFVGAEHHELGSVTTATPNPLRVNASPVKRA